MNKDMTMNPNSIGESEMRVRQYEEKAQLAARSTQTAQQQQALQGEGVKCPYCGTINDTEALFCASCGRALKTVNCPNCGSPVDADADFCESCHRYIKDDVCSFCGAYFHPSDAFCPNCGNPRGGIVCPTCKTMNTFSFCKQCGTPLTEEAKAILAQLKETPQYKELQLLAHNLEQLDMTVSITSTKDRHRVDISNELRERVLRLLQQDAGIANPVIPAPKKEILNRDEMEERRQQLLTQLTEILDQMAIPESASPVQARNYAMAQKPAGVRMAWVCNYKHAMHASPCGCAKPHLGGKWVVLGRNSNAKLENDNDTNDVNND